MEPESSSQKLEPIESPCTPIFTELKLTKHQSQKRKTVTGFELFEILSREEIKSVDLNEQPRSAKRALTMNNVERILGEHNKVNQFSIDDLLEENENRINNSTNYFESPPFGGCERTMSENLSNFIDAKLGEMKESMLNKIEAYKTQLTEKYDNHIDKIKGHVLHKAKRIKQVFYGGNYKSDNTSVESNSPKKEYEYLKKYTLKNMGDKLDQILDTHGKIENAIEKNLHIMGNFLDKFDVFHGNSLENFLNDNVDDILNSWIFSKMNFEKINTTNLIENEKIPHILKNFLFQDTFNKFSIITINRAKSYEFERRLLYDNHLILEKLRLKNLDHLEFSKIFNQMASLEGLQFKKLRKIAIIDSRIEAFLLNNLFKNAEQILLKNCFIKSNLQNMTRDFSNLKTLHITKSNINNKSFLNLIEDLSLTPQILEQLQTFNLSENKISIIDFSPLLNSNKKLTSLQILNLHKNKIYKFKSQNLNCMPSIKVINLSNNNFTSAKDFIELRDKSQKLSMLIYISINKNIFTLNSNSKNILYIEYLTDNLQKFNYFLRKLDISFIFDNRNKENIEKLIFNSNIQISLKKLNFSYSSLETNLFKTFINNNTGFINLRTLNLSNNLLDDSFLETWVNENFNNILENLEYLNLSFNKITDGCTSNIEIFLKHQKKIKKVKLINNPIENSLVNYINTSKLNDSNLEQTINLIGEDNSDYFKRFTFEEFIEKLFEIKKEFKLIFSKHLHTDSLFRSNSLGFTTKKNKILSNVIHFE